MGLHTAAPVHLRLRPAPPDTGYVFVRTDLDNFEIPATVEHIAHCSYATTLMRTGVMLSTVEHLLSALRGCAVDNVYVEIDNLELPIMDGSADDFTHSEPARAARRSPRCVAPCACASACASRESAGWSRAGRGLRDRCTIDFTHPLIGRQHFYFDALDSDGFAREVSPARTFGFTEEIEALRRANLIRGGTLDNAIVLTPDGMLNETPLRTPDEFVRHKILDIIGDLALLGMPVLGRFTAVRSGHIIHALLDVETPARDSPGRSWTCPSPRPRRLQLTPCGTRPPLIKLENTARHNDRPAPARPRRLDAPRSPDTRPVAPLAPRDRLAAVSTPLRLSSKNSRGDEGSAAGASRSAAQEPGWSRARRRSSGRSGDEHFVGHGLREIGYRFGAEHQGAASARAPSRALGLSERPATRSAT